MVIIKNEFLNVEISELGAEIRRVQLNGRDRFWSGDASVWSGVAPVLFPICGSVRDGKYTFEGETYNIEKHGFARSREFEVEDKGEDRVVFLLRENTETLKQYPWKFEFRVEYKLKNNTINVKFSVKNTSDKSLYAAFGAHEAYDCSDGLENYDIIFDKNETLNTALLEGPLLSGKTKPILKSGKYLSLYYKYFYNDAMIFENVKSKKVKLVNRVTNEGVTVNFKGFTNLLFWAKPNADYLCIEPWTCLPSKVDDDYDISKKDYMAVVKPNRTFVKKHSVTLE